MTPAIAVPDAEPPPERRRFWKWRPPARRRGSVVAALVAVAAAGLLPQTPFLERLELRSQDVRFAVRGPRQTSAKVVVVALDDETVAAWANQPMAFWGARYAELVRQARGAGAAWIGLDITPATRAEESLQMLVAGAAERARAGGDRLTDDALDALLATPEMTPDTQFRNVVQAASGRVILADSIRQGSLLTDDLRELIPETYVGFVDPPSQEDAVVRTYALFVPRDDGAIQPSFAALLAARARGRDPARESDLQRLLGAGARDPDLETFWINYTGKRFRVIRAEDMVRGRLTRAERRDLDKAIVLVGPTHRDANDWHRVPGGGSLPGVTIHAHALATLLDGRALHRWSRPQEGLVAAALVLVLALPVVLLPLGWGLGVCAAAGSLWWWAACQFFARGDTLLPVVGPLLGIAFLFFAVQAVCSWEEARARGQVERVFGRYVSPRIRNYLLESAQHLQMGGVEEEKEASVLFFDVRDSTRRAEKIPPEQAMQELNALFRAVVPVLDRHGGLLYGFRGDGFLAVFGAPFPLDNHAQAATDAAREIVRAVHQLNAARDSKEAPPWEVGCGIHSGRLVFGNLGIAERAEFTVIGDTVNLAARLEGLNKTLNKTRHSEIVLSEATFQSLFCPPPVHGPTVCDVAGRQEPVGVYVVTEV